ncbi:MAG: DUF4386 domain-containing protein [Candidatus Krumholzibacteriia bacterium]
MTRPAPWTQPLRLARLAGALYLVIIACGIFGEVAVRGSLIVRGDAGATVANILAAEGLFRLGFTGDLVVFLCDVAVTILLYVLLRPVDRTLALMSAGFQLVGTAIYGVNLLNYFAALLIADGGLAALPPPQQHALALLFLDIHKHGYDLGLVFFGVHCLLLGVLLYRAAYFPRLLGILLVLAGLGYLVGSGTLFLFPAAVGAVAPVYAAPLVGELALCFWLLIKGLRLREWPDTGI